MCPDVTNLVQSNGYAKTPAPEPSADEKVADVAFL
jgi:hypothetical protein